MTASARYRLKRALLRPRIAYRRRRDRDLDQLTRAMLEAHGYRPSLYRFMAAVADNPDLLTDLEVDEQSIVLDLGAFDGEWSEAVADRYGARVLAFEPDPTARPRLENRLGGHPRVRILPYGLGGADAVANLALEGPGSTVYASNGTFGTAEIEICDIARVLDELDADEVDAMKINIEGSEYDVLDRLAETGWLPRIRLLSIQFHEWAARAHARRRANRRTLRRTHEVAWSYPWVWEQWRRRDTIGPSARA